MELFARAGEGSTKGGLGRSPGGYPRPGHALPERVAGRHNAVNVGGGGNDGGGAAVRPTLSGPSTSRPLDTFTGATPLPSAAACSSQRRRSSRRGIEATFLSKGGPSYRGRVLHLPLRPIGATAARQIPVLKVTRSNRVSVTQTCDRIVADGTPTGTAPDLEAAT